MHDPTLVHTGQRRFRAGALMFALAALVALGLTGWRYLTPLSGVTGAGGALLAMFGAFILVLAGLMLLRVPRGRWRSLLLGLSALGVALTLIAELFLHGWGASVALAVAVIAIAVEILTPPARRVAS
ncbi:hypothetical protein MWN34_06255 [Ancylobacter sp. 6x-1]|uniref:Integral membrane protein n=1 Tax=Ancylobacter crimeensis TaxID=2579147 RepID=A0ABT0D995_9HYPH|nr:hypothetical protein [Ancylobacter crimeensis]MCK0196512.1 hypothetical protein [Ancylobacter crimeensis]